MDVKGGSIDRLTVPDSVDCGRDDLILKRCAALGLPLLKAVQMAVASDKDDPCSLLELLDLDFSTFEPVQRRRPKRWLWMAASTASVSYRSTMTEEVLLATLRDGEVACGFEPHIGHLLDEAPISMVVLAVEEAARRSNKPIRDIWRNIGTLAARYSIFRARIWRVNSSDVSAVER